MSMERPDDRFDDERDRRREAEGDQPSTGTATEDREQDLEGRRDLADERAAGATPMPAGGPATTAPADEQLTAPEDRAAAAAAERGPATTAPASGTPTRNGEDFRVFEQGDLEGFRSRWDTIQASFVDDPKRAAEQADALVGDLLRRLGERHAALHGELGSRSDTGSDTEAMRTAVRQYRVFFRSIVTD